MIRLWIQAGLRAAAVLGASWLLTALLGVAPAWSALGPSAYLCWHLYQLQRMSAWLQRADDENPPDVPGMWGELGARLRGLIFRDRQREQHLQATLRAYRESTAAMPDATVALNGSREILWFNEAAHMLLGLQQPVDIGQRVDSLLRLPQFGEYLAAETHDAPLEMASPVDAGLRLSLHVIRYGSGQRLLLFRDNTRLHELEAVRRKFVANASHELRTPLTVISGYLEQMGEDEQVTDQWGMPLEEMQRQAVRMTQIIHDLLDLSRLESSVESARYNRVDVENLVGDIVASARLRPRAMPQLFEDLDPGCDLLGSERELHSLFSNLITNAIRYTPADGKVWVSWKRDGEGAVFAVRDTGVGIDAKHLPRLTERFYRVDKGRAREDGGTGLGLAIVKHVIQRHGGELLIESEEGVGSAFSCRFPAERLSIRAGSATTEAADGAREFTGKAPVAETSPARSG